jgi:ribosomal-protein-alanine N-acetyltransferase
MSGLALRQLERSDIAAWYRYLSLPAVLEHTSWNLSGPEDLEARWALCEPAAADSPIRLAIIDVGGSRLAGTIGFHTVSERDATAELAYDLSPDYWGRGIATAICRTFTLWSYEALRLQRVQATVLETNLRSERVLRRCGFVYEGLLRSYRRVRGRPGNFKMYSRLATDRADPDS